MTEESLTRYEVLGLKSAFTFADGHAYHDMPSPLLPIMENLNLIWNESGQKSLGELEEEFKRATSRIIRSPVLGYHSAYSVCPTASNSIDIVAAWLAQEGKKVALIEPSFDNLSLILSRRKVTCIPFDENITRNLEQFSKLLDEEAIDSVLLVSPNNPTGFKLNEREFCDLCQLLRSRCITIILDTTFRFYSQLGYDEYQIFLDHDLDYIIIEDTGKTWPTDDLKVSLLAYSPRIAASIRTIYEEIYLCTSNFSLCLLSKLIDKTRLTGIDTVVWNEVYWRRMKYKEILGERLTIVETKDLCCFPLLWLDCSKTGLTDLALVELLKRSGIVILPGRYFFWSRRNEITNLVRLSLLRSSDMFEKGLKALASALDKI